MSLANIEGGVRKGEWIEITQERRTGRFLFFFPTESWVTVKEKTISKEIHAVVDEYDVISAVYVNGKRYVVDNNKEV